MRGRRLRLRRADLHFSPANSDRKKRVFQIHRSTARGCAEVEEWRSAGRVNRSWAPDPRERCHPGSRLDTRGGARGSKVAVRGTANWFRVGTDHSYRYSSRDEGELSGNISAGSDGRTLR